MKRVRKLLFNSISIIFCISIGPILSGQVDIEWSTVIDEFDDSGGSTVRQTTDGGYIAVGTVHLAPRHPVWLLKIDPDGNVEWSKTIGRGGFDGGHDVQQTIDGGYVIIGGDNDLWLIKTDANGDTLWTRTYESQYWSSAIKQTLDGGYIITNGTKLLRTDMNGDSLWTRTYDGKCYAHEITSDGGFIIVGSVYSGEDYDTDVWLAKINPEGDTMWTRTFKESGEEGSNFVQQTEDGGYIVAAIRNWYPYGSHEGYLIKIDSIGNTQWTSVDTLYISMIVNELEDGSYLLLGELYESPWYHVCLTKVDNNGHKIWTKHSEQEFKCSFNAGQATNDGGFILIGDIEAGGGNGNLCLAKVGYNVTSAYEKTDRLHLSILPNPTSSIINIGIDHPEVYTIHVYSSNGHLLYSERSKKSNHQIDLSSFHRGIYFITLSSNDFLTTKKIIKL